MNSDASQAGADGHAPAGADVLGALPRYADLLPQLEGRMQAAEKAGVPFTVAVVDMDGLGRLNREHGPTACDEALRALVASMSELCGGEDLARCGGDAVLLVFEGLEKEEVFLRVEAARRTYAERPPVPDGAGGAVSATWSAGVASSPEDGTRPQDVVRKAIDAIYRAKAAGANRVCLAREEKMATKTTYYTQGQLAGLQRLARRMGMSEADLLREALDDLTHKHNA